MLVGSREKTTGLPLFWPHSLYIRRRGSRVFPTSFRWEPLNSDETIIFPHTTGSESHSGDPWFSGLTTITTWTNGDSSPDFLFFSISSLQFTKVVFDNPLLKDWVMNNRKKLQKMSVVFQWEKIHTPNKTTNQKESRITKSNYSHNTLGPRVRNGPFLPSVSHWWVRSTVVFGLTPERWDRRRLQTGWE